MTKPLSHVFVLMASNREPEHTTKQCVAAMQQHGAAFLLLDGHSDVTQARNNTLSVACEVARAHPELRCVLMLDDDMIVTPENALELAREALTSGYATSAVYATSDGRLAGARWKYSKETREWPEGLRERWQMGLGCFAIPIALLLELESRCERYEIANKKILTAFTWSKAEAGMWVAEDYRLCRQLGGARVVPMAVGHIKKGGIWPDDETLAAVREGRQPEPLPGGALQLDPAPELVLTLPEAP